jgi:hypothetical protein
MARWKATQPRGAMSQENVEAPEPERRRRELEGPVR